MIFKEYTKEKPDTGKLCLVWSDKADRYDFAYLMRHEDYDGEGEEFYWDTLGYHFNDNMFSLWSYLDKGRPKIFEALSVVKCTAKHQRLTQ